jgi:hypothetical protein
VLGAVEEAVERILIFFEGFFAEFLGLFTARLFV